MTAPTGEAEALERIDKILSPSIWGNGERPRYEDTRIALARALTEYGNERAPREADVMERARATMDGYWASLKTGRSSTPMALFEDIARALAEYGDYRAREARAVNEFIVEYGERRAREARAAAIEQCKAIAREHQAPSVLRAIADLADTPSEGGER